MCISASTVFWEFTILDIDRCICEGNVQNWVLSSPFKFPISYNIELILICNAWSSFERSVTFFEWDSNVVVHQSMWRDVCNQIVQSSGSEIKIEPPRDANASMQTASFTRETAFDATFTSKTIWYVVSGVIGAMLGKYFACVKHEQARETVWAQLSPTHFIHCSVLYPILSNFIHFMCIS